MSGSTYSHIRSNLGLEMRNTAFSGEFSGEFWGEFWADSVRMMEFCQNSVRMTEFCKNSARIYSTIRSNLRLQHQNILGRRLKSNYRQIHFTYVVKWLPCSFKSIYYKNNARCLHFTEITIRMHATTSSRMSPRLSVIFIVRWC